MKNPFKCGDEVKVCTEYCFKATVLDTGLTEILVKNPVTGKNEYVPFIYAERLEN